MAGAWVECSCVVINRAREIIGRKKLSSEELNTWPQDLKKIE
jgi:hypothetical protein